MFLSICCFAPAIHRQDAVARPSFEAADIKPAAARRNAPQRAHSARHIELPGGTVKLLIMAAHGAQENMVSGLPKRAESERFDIVAKRPKTRPVPTSPLMLRTLLAERFHLRLHHAEKIMSAYAQLEPSSARRQRVGQVRRRALCAESAKASPWRS